jgi:hypothetical protein
MSNEQTTATFHKRGYVHKLFKKFKVGLLKEEDLSCSDRALLLQYYPFLFDDDKEF